MVRQPIDEISCCNCPDCQKYILALQKRIEALEEFAQQLKTLYVSEYGEYLIYASENKRWKKEP